MRFLLCILAVILTYQSVNAQSLWRNSATTNRVPWLVSGYTNIVGTLTNPITTAGAISSTGGFTSAGSNYFGGVSINPLATYSGIGTGTSGAPRVVIGTNTPSGDDSAILIARNIGGSGLFSHAILDESTFTTIGNGGYASFDSYYTVTGSEKYNHMGAFQARPTYSGTGLIDEIVGFTSLPRITSGEADFVYGFRIFPPTISPGASNRYCIAIGIDPNWSTNIGAKYVLYSLDTTIPSYHGGIMQLGSNLLAAGSVSGANIWGNDAFNSVGLGTGSRSATDPAFFLTSIGYNAGHSLASAVSTFNTFVGASAGYSDSVGSLNTYIGSYAGYAATGDGNVFLGHKAGYNETGSNLLYIANSDTATPLIKGDFAGGTVTVAGDIRAATTITATNGFFGGNLTEGNYLAVGANGLIINTNSPEARIVGSTNKLDTDLRQYTLNATNKLDTDLKSYTDTAKLNATNGLYAALKATYTPMTTNGHVAGTFTLGQFQRTNTAAAITITSLTGAAGNDALSGVLVISNSAATSQLITWPAEWINNLGYVSAYCTNAECMIISVNCLPGIMTNAAIVRTRKGAAGVAP